MGWVSIGKSSEFPPGEVREIRVYGEPYAVCNTASGVYVLEGRCPHLGGPLGHGALHGTVLVCPWHLWEFDCQTGHCLRDASVRLATFRVRIQDGELWMEDPRRAGATGS